MSDSTAQVAQMTNDEKIRQIVVETGLPENLVPDFRFAQLLARSSIVPDLYRGNVANCFIAVSTAKMLKLDPFFVMCGTFVFEGKLCWYSKHIQVVFKMRMGVDIEFEYDDSTPNNARCRAFATIKGVTKHGPWISQQMARDSKWKSLLWSSAPEFMLHYRAAAWLINTKYPEVLCGIGTDHDSEDASHSKSIASNGLTEAVDLGTNVVDISSELHAAAASRRASLTQRSEVDQ